jgi:hypothetical protein
MSSIDGRFNGQPAYNPAPSPSREAWREEMLGQFLNQMKERKLPQETGPESRSLLTPKIGKGSYINIYV